MDDIDRETDRLDRLMQQKLSRISKILEENLDMPEKPKHKQTLKDGEIFVETIGVVSNINIPKVMGKIQVRKDLAKIVGVSNIKGVKRGSKT